MAAMSPNEDVGHAHNKANHVTSVLRWDLRLSLFSGPLIVGAVVFILVALCCSLGIAGLVGAIDTVICGITITVLTIPISLLETLLLAVSLSAHHKWMVLENIIKKIKKKAEENKTTASSCEQQQQWNETNQLQKQSMLGHQARFRNKVMDLLRRTLLTDIEKLHLDETFKDFESNPDKIPRFAAWSFLFCSWGSFGSLCGFLFFNASFNCIYWGLAITILEFNPPVWYVYLVVNLLVGVASPALFCLSIFILAAILDEHSPLDVKLEALVPAFLTFVAYVDKEDGKSAYAYWNIVGYFHFFIYPNPKLTRNDFLKIIKMRIVNKASWYLLGMVFVTFCLSVTYIVDQLLTGEQYVFSCSEVKGDDYNCFEHYSNRYVNCSIDNSTKIDLDCFRFNRVGVQSDPVGVIITAMFLYLACEKFLMITFKFVRELHKLYPGSIWGMGLTGFGLFLLLLCCACTVLYDRIHSVYFDFQKLLQFYIISTDIFLSGMCILTVEYVQCPDLIKDDDEHLKMAPLEQVIEKAALNNDGAFEVHIERENNNLLPNQTLPSEV